MIRRRAGIALVALLLGAVAPARALTVELSVGRHGDLVILDATLTAPVARDEAWAVLTDFDAMSRYVPNLRESRITLRSGNQLRVEQQGVAHWGPFSQDFVTVRDIDLVPMTNVRSRSIGGSLPRLSSETRFADTGDGTQIRHHLEFALQTWMPEFLAEAFLRHEVTEQFEALVQEMLRRRAAAQR